MKKILLSLLLTIIYTQGTFSGVTYFDYTYDLTEDAENDDGFGLKRVYFTYKQDLSENISYKFQTDVGQLEVGGLEGIKKTQFVAYLKKAQLDWETLHGKFTFGMQGMNIFNVTEKTWGFRFLQKSAIDKYKLSSSADMGIKYAGKFNKLNYSIMVTNGSGYKQSENDQYKKTSIQVVYGEKKLVKNDGFNIGLSFASEPYNHTETEKAATMLLSVYSGYAANGLRIGAEYDRYRDAGEDISKQIIAGYISYELSEKIEGIFYIDNFDSDVYYNGNENEDLIRKTDLIVGVNYKPEKGLTIAPNLRISKPDDGHENTMFMLNFEFKF